jgi:antitoxin FitA
MLNGAMNRLRCAVQPDSRVRMGDALSALGRTLELANEDFEVFDQVRDELPATRISFPKR